MGAEYHHGCRRSSVVPARRALKVLRRARAAVASLALFAAAFNAVVPALSAFNEPVPLDPRFAALLKARSCGEPATKTKATPPAALPHPVPSAGSAALSSAGILAATGQRRVAAGKTHRASPDAARRAGHGTARREANATAHRTAHGTAQPATRRSKHGKARRDGHGKTLSLRRAPLRAILAAKARRGLGQTFAELRTIVKILARAVLASPKTVPAATEALGYDAFEPRDPAPNAADTPLPEPPPLGRLFVQVGALQSPRPDATEGSALAETGVSPDARFAPKMIAAIVDGVRSDVPDAPAPTAGDAERYPGTASPTPVRRDDDPRGLASVQPRASARPHAASLHHATHQNPPISQAHSGAHGVSTTQSRSHTQGHSQTHASTQVRARPFRLAQAPSPSPSPASDSGASAPPGSPAPSTPAPAASESPTTVPSPSASAAPTPATPQAQSNPNQSNPGGATTGGGDQVTPLAPLPGPSPSASLLPLPPVPASGPQQIIEPTPRPAAGSATASPVPLPAALPSANPNQPVFLVRPSGTPSPLPLIGNGGSSPAPQPTQSGGTPKPTLQPYQIVTIADKIVGSTDENKPSDLSGNVHVFYVEGQIVGDRAHFDGDHTITLRGHTYLVNRSQDSILYADQIVFDMRTRRATLVNGRGESIEGVAQGKLHFRADTLTTRTDGVAHGDHASFTTCENPHAGYHVEARTIDVTPGDKLVARKAVVFLGPLAIFYLPLLVIPLRGVDDPRRQASFLPLVGYDQTEGAWIKLRIGFAPSNTYYGYYRVEYFTKRGLGLGYDAYIGAKDNHRYTTIDAYTIDDHVEEARLTNINIQDNENFNKRLRAQFGVNYEGDFGPDLSLPASLDITGSIIHQTGTASTENLTFSRFLQGSLSDNLNLGFIDSITLNQFIQQQINLTYAKFNSQISSSDTFQIDLNTHVFTKAADYNFTYNKTDYSSEPFGYDSVPELQVMPHLSFGGFRYVPQVQFTVGEYAEPENHFSTSRFQGQINEAYYAKLFGNSDFTANYNLTQDYYGTGDEKAFDQQNAALSTPIGNHLVNSLTYNEQHPIGPSDVPFQLLDNLSPGAHSAQEVIRFYNKDVYSFSLSAGTQFDRMAQPVSYQLNYKPSPRSYLVLGGYFTPGPGQGFGETNVQAITPLGKDTTLELTTNVDWMNHMQLADKNIYLSQIVDNCYQLQLSYNQDLKQFSFQVVILAFPSAGAGFGFTGAQSNSIIPQNLNF